MQVGRASNYPPELLMTLFAEQDLWLCCWNKKQQGRPHSTSESRTPERIQALHGKNVPELDKWNAGEKFEYEGSC